MLKVTVIQGLSTKPVLYWWSSYLFFLVMMRTSLKRKKYTCCLEVLLENSPVSSTYAVNSPLFTNHREEETNGKGCKARKPRGNPSKLEKFLKTDNRVQSIWGKCLNKLKAQVTNTKRLPQLKALHRCCSTQVTAANTWESLGHLSGLLMETEMNTPE